MNKERREAYVELLEILKHMDKKYIAKIPKDLIELFEENASKDYQFHINPKIPIEYHVFKKSTINILAMLNINYWCESEKQKQELLRKYHENDIKKQEELNNKYSIDNLFKKENKKNSVESKEQTSTIPVIYKENKWYKKIYTNILEFVKKIFNRNK